MTAFYPCSSSLAALPDVRRHHWYTMGFVGNVAVPKSDRTWLFRDAAGTLIVECAPRDLRGAANTASWPGKGSNAGDEDRPPGVERSTTSAREPLAMLLCCNGGPLPPPCGGPHPAGARYWTGLRLGWGLVFASSFRSITSSVFGVSQLLARAFSIVRRPASASKYGPVSPRAAIPLYLGFLLAFWATRR